MRFIDHQQIEDRDGSEMVVARQRCTIANGRPDQDLSPASNTEGC